MKHSDINIKILGGGQEIGANCYLLEWGKYNIILDSGMNPGKAGYEAIPAFDMLHQKEIDAVIISHAHLDHIGSLPFLTLSYLALGGKVFMTPPNRELLPHMLKESVKAIERGRIPEEELYYYHQFFDRYLIKDLKKHGGIFCDIDYEQEFEVVPGIKGVFFRAGHILGSAGVVLTDGDHTFVYTGDICNKNQTILSSCSLPHVDKTDCLLIESTHGSDPGKNQKDRKDEYYRLANAIKETINRGGHVLIPSFGLGRSQDIVIMLSHMKKEGLIQESIPVFYHMGVTAGVNKIYDQFQDYLINMGDRTIASCCNGTNGYYNNGKFKRAGELSKEPAIFVFTGGMMNRGTPAALLAGELVQSERNGIFFCGYTAPNELGYELANIKTGQSICLDIEQQKWVKVICPHIHKFSFSAHAKREELLKIARHFDPDICIWVHGDASSTNWLSQNYAGAHQTACSYAPGNRETIALRTGTKKINRPLKDFKAVLITVGTSMLTTYLKRSGRPNSDYENVTKDELQNYIMANLHDLPLLSAETNSLNSKKVEPTDFLYFICGDNKQGQLCGNILKQLYEDSHICRLVKIDGLRPEAGIFKERGMKNLLEQVVGIIESHDGNAIIHATGGFKAQIAIATLLGILFKNEVYYLYEDFQEVVQLPEIPLGFDFKSIFPHKGQFFTLMDGREYWKMDEIYARLPEMIKPCFYKDKIQKKYSLTPLGRGIFSSFQRYMGQKAREIPLVVTGESALWGEEQDSISKILNPVIGMLMERISRYQELIRGFEFSSVKKRSVYSNPGDENYLELTKKETDRLIYRIEHVGAQKGAQDILTISTSAGASPYLLDMLGRKIYP